MFFNIKMTNDKGQIMQSGQRLKQSLVLTFQPPKFKTTSQNLVHTGGEQVP